MQTPAYLVGRMEVVESDITTLAVDAIVNAANPSLLGGGGVDGAIHRVAGPFLVEACRRLGGCRKGEAKITPGYDLPSDFVIHTVGPLYHGGKYGEANILRDCYRNSLRVAVQHGCKRVAFPAIATGAYGYPAEEAAEIAIRTVNAVLRRHPDMRVTFCCYGDRMARIYRQALRRIAAAESVAEPDHARQMTHEHPSAFEPLGEHAAMTTSRVRT